MRRLGELKRGEEGEGDYVSIIKCVRRFETLSVAMGDGGFLFLKILESLA